MVGGFEEFVIQDESGEKYQILFLPDRNNDELQNEGKPPVYYWVPGTVRMARKGDTGDYKFHHIHFVGTMSEDTHVGVEGNSEVSGGVLSFTTTSRYPTSVMKQAEEQFLAKWRGKNDRYWGWRSSVAPEIRICPITKNVTVITSLAPARDGVAPVEGGGDGGAGEPRSLPRVTRTDLSQRVVHGRDVNLRRGAGLDAWAWQLQGEGNGSVTGGENAYSGLIGSLPSEIVWAGFHGAYSPIAVAQNLLLQLWTPSLYLKITGKWDRIFQHFSAHVNAKYLWFAADIQAEFNNLRISGGITVDMAVDGTIPTGQELEKEVNKRIDVITAKFMEQAAKVIFDPPQPKVEPAKAPSGGLFSSFFGYGGGVALKARRDEQHVDLFYEETRHHRYLQPTTISSTLEGFYNEIKADPNNEKKYFTRLVLGELNRKISRIVKPVVNWPVAGNALAGDPVGFVSAQIGYPNSQGAINWNPHEFQSTDTGPTTTWTPVSVMWRDGEVSNPPSGWTPDKTYIKRTIHLLEPPGEDENPFRHVFVEKNTIELDPQPDGTLTNDNIVEVRADSVGKLEVGPILINGELESSKQMLEVEFQCFGKTLEGKDRSVTRFIWKFDDQNEARSWEIFTGDPAFVPHYQYRVTVNVKGTIFSKGMSWTGAWQEVNGNGPVTLVIPTQEEAVTRRSLTPRQIVERDAREAGIPGEKAAPAAGTGTGTGTGTGAPPSDDGMAPPMDDGMAPPMDDGMAPPMDDGMAPPTDERGMPSRERAVPGGNGSHVLGYSAGEESRAGSGSRRRGKRDAAEPRGSDDGRREDEMIVTGYVEA
jgi:hypothetical protein